MGRKSSLIGDLADDGKRSPALDVWVEGRRLYKGRGLGRGVGRKSSLTRDLADFPLLWHSSRRMLTFALQTGPKLVPSSCPAPAQLSPSSFPALPQLLPTLLRARSARSEDALADSPRFSQFLPDSPRLSQILRFSPMLPDSPRFSQILPDSPTLSQTLFTLPSSPRLSRTLPNVARLCQTQTRFPFMLLQVCLTGTWWETRRISHFVALLG